MGIVTLTGFASKPRRCSIFNHSAGSVKTRKQLRISEMKRIWLLGLLVQPALCASFPLDPASARITGQEEFVPASPTEFDERGRRKT